MDLQWVQWHNQFRSFENTQLQPLEYSYILEQSAKRHALKCMYMHSNQESEEIKDKNAEHISIDALKEDKEKIMGNNEYYGENIWKSNVKLSYESKIVQDWWKTKF